MKEAADLLGFWTYLMVMGAGSVHGEALAAAYDLATAKPEALPAPRRLRTVPRSASARRHRRLTGRYAATAARSLASVR